MRAVQLIAIPYDSGRRGARMGRGPLRLLEAGLAARLETVGYDVASEVVLAGEAALEGEIASTFSLAARTAAAVERALGRRRFPLVLSGNCGPAALGALAALPGGCRVYWFDAHGDFNTPETSTSGFLDGMALAVLTGRCWREVARAIPGFRPVDDAAVVLVGARDLDPLERQALDASRIRRVGVEAVRAGALGSTPPSADAYVHVDLDVFDPSVAVMNGFASPAGLHEREFDQALAAIAAAGRVRAASVTALDPDADARGRGIEAALAVCSSLLRCVCPAGAQGDGRAGEA